MASPERQELIRSAVSFLSDPKTQSSSFAQRMQFLEAKGLTGQEIEEAMRLSSSTPMGYNSGYRTPYPSSYEPSVYSLQHGPQPWDWRDYFIMSVVSGSFVYGVVSLARKYLLPHMRPPTSTAYEADRDALTAQFDAAEALLKEIQAETSSVRQAVDEQKVKVDEATQNVEAAVKEMKEGDARNRDDIREIRDEVNSIREMLPKMIDKSKESQSQSLAELQQELKSLKALLLSRGPSYSSVSSPSLPTLSSRPSIPSWQLNGGSQSDLDPISNPTPIAIPSAISVDASPKKDEPMP